ncbi:adenine phosphoribosyltransferase [Thiohalorhabdus methylotrophus]|uniref:Adenine phosphoribosyltransferase n=1 Tax=Thiohalorhabdus methylotrophus TaxID=3242694 RepID=A0ABV4TXA5_9GAMM
MSQNPSLRERVRSIPDYPKPGIIFRDITTLLQDPAGFRETVDLLVAPFEASAVDKVVGVEARGFIIGGAVAHQLHAGFVPARKMGKLPWETVSAEYDLEYGTDAIQIHTDCIARGERVLLVDDLIATGGSAGAALDLIEQVGGSVVGCSFVIDLPDLGGSAQLRERGYAVSSLIEFEGD